MPYFFPYGWFHVEPHLRDGCPNQIVIMFQRDMSIGIQSMCLLNVSPEVFSVLSTPDFGWSNMFLRKKRFCSFLRFTHLFLRFSALPRALYFSLRSCQILSRPFFLSVLAKRICFFKFLFFFILRSNIILWRLFFLTCGLLFFSFTP